ncbi:MAG: exodeoxyribonuclease VII large subunit [Planctomycetes bacterium]|nr:exodeoxyribonuclease VII large subunit [Planctomycetota bacterium]
MPRLPFNPDRVPAPKSKSGASGKPTTAPPGGGLFGGAGGDKGDRPMTVAQLAALIRDALAKAVPGKVRVVGEISNFSQRAHWFFSLKDEAAAIRCVCFASSARKVAFPVEDGMQVVITGRLDFYDAQGNVQLYVDSMEPVGQGALEMRFRALCEELRKLGYFDPDRKKPLPAMPRRVAVVTSRSAAALQDVINTARRRWAGCELLLFDVRVQGEAAAGEIARAIDALSRDGPSLGIDAVILTRGGGSIEDLWAFNERVVADALFRCPLPVIAAIGHETDITVAELVADVRASTPTQAAMTLIPDRGTMDQQVNQLAHRLALVLRRQAELSRHRLDAAAKHPLFRRPGDILLPHVEQLNDLSRRLTPLLGRRMQEADRRLKGVGQRLAPSLSRRLSSDVAKAAALARQLEAVGPINVLRRGYSYTLGPDGRLVRSAATVNPGDAITSILADGRVNSTVNDSAAAPNMPPNKPSRTLPATPAHRHPRKSTDQPGLFGGPSSAEGDAP